METPYEDKHILVGDEFSIEEMPQGCILSEVTNDGQYTGRVFRISSSKDALMIIESLNRMLKAQYPELIRAQALVKISE